MAVNVKLGVDLGDFKSGIASAKEEIKTFDAALKYAEASLKSTGDAESALTTKTEALRGKLEAQKKVVDQYTDALQKMNAAGVEKTSSSYQKMQTNLLNAKAAMETTRAQINDLNTSQTNAAKSADDLATNVGKIGKNVSLQTLSDGLSKLNNSLERGARTAIRMGRTIARSAMSSTGWADDLSTRSTQYGIDVETLQRMENVAAYIDTDVDAIISARDRMSKNRESLAELLGISTDGRSVDDVFWEAGEAIMKLGEGLERYAGPIRRPSASQLRGQAGSSDLRLCGFPHSHAGANVPQAAVRIRRHRLIPVLKKVSTVSPSVRKCSSMQSALEQKRNWRK